MELFTTVNGNMVKDKEEELKSGQMDLIMRAIGQTTKLTGKVV